MVEVGTRNVSGQDIRRSRTPVPYTHTHLCPVHTLSYTCTVHTLSHLCRTLTPVPHTLTPVPYTLEGLCRAHTLGHLCPRISHTCVPGTHSRRCIHIPTPSTRVPTHTRPFTVLTRHSRPSSLVSRPRPTRIQHPPSPSRGRSSGWVLESPVSLDLDATRRRSSTRSEDPDIPLSRNRFVCGVGSGRVRRRRHDWGWAEAGSGEGGTGGRRTGRFLSYFGRLGTPNAGVGTGYPIFIWTNPRVWVVECGRSLVSRHAHCRVRKEHRGGQNLSRLRCGRSGHGGPVDDHRPGPLPMDDPLRVRPGPGLFSFVCDGAVPSGPGTSGWHRPLLLVRVRATGGRWSIPVESGTSGEWTCPSPTPW